MCETSPEVIPDEEIFTRLKYTKKHKAQTKDSFLDEMQYEEAKNYTKIMKTLNQLSFIK